MASLGDIAAELRGVLSSLDRDARSSLHDVSEKLDEAHRSFADAVTGTSHDSARDTLRTWSGCSKPIGEIESGLATGGQALRDYLAAIGAVTADSAASALPEGPQPAVDTYQPILGSAFGVPIMNLQPVADRESHRFAIANLKHRQPTTRGREPQQRKGFRTGVVLAGGTLLGSFGKDLLSLVWSGVPGWVAGVALGVATGAGAVQLWWDKRKERRDDN